MSSSTSAAASAFRALAKSRRSIRRFEPNKSIPENVLRDIFETTITSPSGFNLQPTQVIMVTSEEVKKELADGAMLGMGNVYRTKDASAMAVFCSDLQCHNGRIQRIQQLEEEEQHRDVNYMAVLPVASTFLTSGNPLARVVANHLSPFQPMPTLEPSDVWSCKNTSLLVQTYVFAAQSHGLGTCIMEGYDARRVKQILNIPTDRYAVPMMVATGYEYQQPQINTSPPTPRLPLHQVFFQNTFGNPIDKHIGISKDNMDNQTTTTESQPHQTEITSKLS